MSLLQRKRFWKKVDISSEGEGFAVTLDGKTIRTPSKAQLIVPTQALADAIAAEWDALEDVVDPNKMPHTRGANSAIDKLSLQFDDVVGLLAEYGGTDLLCYRADSPQTLVARQNAEWDPWLDWARKVLQVNLAQVAGVIHIQQDQGDLAQLHKAVAGHSAFELVGVHDMITLTGSCVLGLAMSSGALSAEQAWQLSRLDELWQADFWGTDEDAEVTAAKKFAELRHAEQFLKLARGN